MGARDLARINKLPYDTILEPGGTCVVYKVVDRKASDRAAAQARATRDGEPRRRGKKPASKPRERERQR